MDLFGQLQQINQAPERVRGRQLRRARRRAEIYDRVASAIGPTKAVDAAVRWSLHAHDPNEDLGVAIGHQHPAQVAITAVRQALSEFNMPTDYSVRWVGSTRTGGRGPHQMSDGVIKTEVALRSTSGVNRVIDVPIVVRQGRALAPVVFIDQGVVRAMTQSAFDDLFAQGTFLIEAPQRETMYSPPPQERRAPQQVPLVRPGMFGLSPINKQLTAAYVRSAMTGQYVADLPDLADACDWNRAEQPVPDVRGGDAVTLSQNLDVVSRDGQRWHLAAGTEGQVQRDVAGDGRQYVVFFPEVGFSVQLGADAIS